MPYVTCGSAYSRVRAGTNTTEQGQSSMCESVFKVLLIGDHSVGKTTFVASYVLNKWIANLKTTIGGKSEIERERTSQKRESV